MHLRCKRTALESMELLIRLSLIMPNSAQANDGLISTVDSVMSLGCQFHITSTKNMVNVRVAT